MPRSRASRAAFDTAADGSSFPARIRLATRPPHDVAPWTSRELHRVITLVGHVTECRTLANPENEPISARGRRAGVYSSIANMNEFHPSTHHCAPDWLPSPPRDELPSFSFAAAG